MHTHTRHVITDLVNGTQGLRTECVISDAIYCILAVDGIDRPLAGAVFLVSACGLGLWEFNAIIVINEYAGQR